jgi:hypothetical protein
VSCVSAKVRVSALLYRVSGWIFLVVHFCVCSLSSVKLGARRDDRNLATWKLIPILVSALLCTTDLMARKLIGRYSRLTSSNCAGRELLFDAMSVALSILHLA